MSRLMPGRQAALFWLTCLLVCAQSLAQETQRSFFADRRAYRQGDLLTILVTENSTVTATAQTTTNKSESAKVSVVDRTGNLRPLAAAFDGSSAGGGQIERSDKLLTKIAVTVQAVDSRGNLTVHGEQDIEVNNEKQRIRLDGMVRPDDIAADNTVPSSRVAAAQIEFTGKGLLARKQSPGLLNRILAWFWE